MYYKNLLRYRQAWLGVAMIWIMLYHCALEQELLHGLIQYGYGGVDICIFASGIGCFYSLASDSDALAFLKRRVKRLAPTYVVFILFWLVYQYAVGEFGLRMAVGNLFALQNFTGLGRDFNWYISAIFLMYILAPYFAAVAERASSVGKVLFLAFLLACSVPFWHASTYIVTITRLPIFYIGMLFADMCRKDRQISRGHAAGIIAAFAVGAVLLKVFFTVAGNYLYNYGLYWYPFILITPPLCVGLSCISMLLEKTKITGKILSFLSLCGNYSFELYLVHIWISEYIPEFISTYDLSRFSNLIWAASLVPLAVGCWLLRRLSVLALGLVSKCCRKCG